MHYLILPSLSVMVTQASLLPPGETLLGNMKSTLNCSGFSRARSSSMITKLVQTLEPVGLGGKVMAWTAGTKSSPAV